MHPEKVADWGELEPLAPVHALVAGVDLVIDSIGLSGFLGQ